MPDLPAIGKWIMNLPPEGLTFLTAIIFGYGVRRLNQLPNKLIVPVSLAVSQLSYFFLAASDPQHDAGWNVTHKIMVGLIIGIVGAITAMALHNKAAKMIADKWPSMAWLVAEDEPELKTVPGAMPVPPTSADQTLTQPKDKIP